jgi:SAM-dependent methyltransferase
VEEAVSAAYERIGVGYDGTRRADPGLVTRLAGLLDVPPVAACLDVGCGTGNYTTAVAARGGRWVGIDISPRMLIEAGAKAAAVRWVLGDARALPFVAGAFSRAMCTLALHHIVDIAAAFAELARQYSDDSTAANGGDAGFFERGTMAPEIERIADALKKNEVSDIIPTKFGHLMIRLVERTAAGIPPLPEVGLDNG